MVVSVTGLVRFFFQHKSFYPFTCADIMMDVAPHPLPPPHPSLPPLVHLTAPPLIIPSSPR